jgi:NADH:ubiquinone oxidoreductase subunit F (NADH-binding)/NADH:ubiquinone oxidoreductase subunit E
MPRATRKRSEAGLPVLRMRPIPKGRPTDPGALEEVRALLGDAPRRPDLLIEHLHRIQDAHGHLSARHLVALATEMRLTPAEVYEVATFYHHFDVVDDGETPPPALTVRVCDSIACELAGAGALIEALQDALGDQVRVTRSPCVGRCDQAPVAVVGENPVGTADVASVKAAVDDGSDGVQLPEYESFEAYMARGGYSAVHTCFGSARATEAMFDRIERFIEEADDSGLRGLGGAGFPAARKWQFVRAEPKPHYMVVNADEGEPGTFKDRYCLETHPHQVLEGMLIAACAVEADDVFLYVRDEYPAAREILSREIEVLKAWPELELPRIHLRRGAGAYICGEETGLIESIEGKRGMPRLRPPFPAQNGVFGLPTLVHNVETLYWLPEILRNGASSFAANGNDGHDGKRLFSVSGRVKRPGVYEAPNGITARQLIDTAGGMLDGHTFYAYLPGGASGGILPASKGDLPLDFGGKLAEHGCFVGSGAVVILSDHDRARDAALNVMRFFADESCGKCTPCRVGTAKSIELMRRDSWDRALLGELGTAMADASICGLGQAAPNPVRCVIEYFPEELES